MTDLQGAIGLVQLNQLDQFIIERARWAEWYRHELASLEWLRCPSEPARGRHAWQAFVTWIDAAEAPCPRNELMDNLHSHGIATRPGTHAVHELGAYHHLESHCPVASECAAQTMALPLHNRMVEEDFETVVEEIRSLNDGHR